MTLQLKPKVIAIAAVSGGGKTTVTKQLQQRLGRAAALHFDDYSCFPPEEICAWVERGSDCNEWDLSPIIHDVQVLLHNENQSLDYILLDYPFAYRHHEMSQYIDYAVFIDTPLDIAMARRILRDFKEADNLSIRNDMENYLNHARNSYLDMLHTIKPNSDDVIDGALPINGIVNEIIDMMNRRTKGEL